MTRILLSGRTGQVGRELQRTLQALGDITAPDRTAMDLGEEEAIRRKVREVRPDIIVNPAAYTAVDRSEEEKGKARLLNSRAPAIMAEEAGRLGSLLIHYSTDYVFDGEKKGRYREDDRPAPLNVYGRTKLEGEEKIRETGCRHLILRTSWVYSLRGTNFLLTMLRLFQEREKLSVIADQTGAPTWARLIAEATALIVHQARREQRQGHFESGTYHLTSRGATTWYGFAHRIREEAENFLGREKMKVKEIAAISSGDYPTAATRPRNSRLDVSALEERFGLRMPAWDLSLHLCLADAGQALK
ncbi:MAG: dTDP-4-dehydrorhamnose reductase [Desulfobia sp.]